MPTAPDPFPDPPGYAARVLARAEAAVRRDAAERHEAIHEVRVAIKRMRSLWWLIEAQVGRPLVRRENDALREATQRLAPLRDRRVTLDALHRLAVLSRGARVREACARAREALSATPDAPIDPPGSSPVPHPEPEGAPVTGLLAAGLQALRDSAALLALLPWRGWGWGHLEPGLRRTYRQGRRRLRACGAERDDAAFHDWRKSAKRLQYQLELVQPALPGARDPHRAVRALGRLLGDAHDLVVLRGHLDALAPALEPAELAALQKAIDRQLRRAYDRALLSGLTFYHRPPGHWTRILRSDEGTAPSERSRRGR